MHTNTQYDQLGHVGRFAPRCLEMVLTLMALMCLASSQAHASWYRTCDGNAVKWNSGWTNMYVNTNSFPAASDWDARLQNAMWHWNNVQGSGFTYYVGYDTDGAFSHSNSVNEIYIPSDNAEIGGALAVTFTRFHCYWLFGWHYGIDETDIGFSNAISWNTGSYDYSNPTGSPFTFESVALHELGHALGLLHEDGGMATMNSFYPNSGPLGYYKEWDPLADDRQGVRFLYPDGTGETDIAGSVLKRTGAGSSDLVSTPAWAGQGTVLSTEFSFANQSTSTQTFNIDFYLSTNTYISITDIHLGTTGWWATAGFTGTFTQSLYIPTWVAPGTYYLGFLIDPSNTTGEANEGNNSQPMPSAIVIY